MWAWAFVNLSRGDNEKRLFLEGGNINQSPSLLKELSLCQESRYWLFFIKTDSLLELEIKVKLSSCANYNTSAI